VYQHIVDAWNDESRWREAVMAACDYHCDSDGYLRYANIPYYVVPAEILALQRIRKEFGLSSFQIDHPLMKTEFTALSATDFHDPLLIAAERTLRATFPEISHPW
jgi:hypothetical protein